MAIYHGKIKKDGEPLVGDIILPKKEVHYIPSAKFEDTQSGLGCDGNTVSLVYNEDNYISLSNILDIKTNTIKHNDLTLHQFEINTQNKDNIILFRLHGIIGRLYSLKFFVYGKKNNDICCFHRTFCFIRLNDNDYKITTIQSDYTYRDSSLSNVDFIVYVENKELIVKIINTEFNMNFKYMYMTFDL